MRIIEPQNYQHQKQHMSRRGHKLAVVLLAFLVSAGVWGYFFVQNSEPEPAMQEVVASTTQEQLVEQPSAPVEEPVVVEPDQLPVSGLKQFAGNDFRLFYDQLKQKNIDPIENPPPISDNVAADQRIQSIAEARGYRLRGSPSVELINVEGYPLQADVMQPWLDLKAAAAAEGHNISIVSAYRSVSHQRTLFLSRLSAAGATIDEVAAGTADQLVDGVLVTSSIPGYSKHHTGYTIDIICTGYAFENFKNSPCNDWITANNYEAAKTHGFIPSYPPEATSQGPDPEAWEFVWVGADLLRL